MCTPAVFARHLRMLEQGRYTVVPMSLLAQAIDSKAVLPARAVALSFDDVRGGMLSHAVPILQQFGVSATLFVDFDRPLNPAGLSLLREAGVEIGHKADFAGLALPLSEPTLRQTLGQSKDRLEQLLGEPVQHLAYPFGWFSARVRGLLDSLGYRSASTSIPQLNTLQTDRFMIRRSAVLAHEDANRFAWRMQRANAQLSHQPGGPHAGPESSRAA